MEIKEQDLLSFIELYKKQFSITLTRTEAHEMASLLLQHVFMCLKPLAKIDQRDINDMPNVSE
jgi:hypothetical protein